MYKYLIALSILFSTVTFAKPTIVNCNDTSKDCLISIADSYLQALVSHDASNVPFADNSTRYENGVNTGTNGKDIAHGLENDFKFKSIKGIRNKRFWVADNEVLVNYLIDVIIPYTNIQVATTHVNERFSITDGKIAEIEAIFCTSVNNKPEDDKSQSKFQSILCNRSLI